MPVTKNPGALAGATGAGLPIQASAGGTPELARNADLRQCAVRLRVAMLRRLHGLTEAQANALAALIWGAGQ